MTVRPIRILAGGREFRQGNGQAAGQIEGELIGDESAGSGLFEAVRRRGPAKAGGGDGEAVDGFLGFLLFLPFAEAAVPPVGDVVFIDGLGRC